MDGFGAKLKLAMNIRKKTATDLAREIGCDRSLIYQYRNDTCAPKQDKLYKIAKCLDVNPDWFLTENAPMVRVNTIGVYRDILDILRTLSEDELKRTLSMLKVMYQK